MISATITIYTVAEQLPPTGVELFILQSAFGSWEAGEYTNALWLTDSGSWTLCPDDRWAVAPQVKQ